MTYLRHGPLALWLGVCAVLFSVGALALAVPSSQVVESSPPASPAELRSDVLDLRTRLAYLVSLSRTPDLELAEEAGALAGHVAVLSQGAGGEVGDLYQELVFELVELELLVREHLDAHGQPLSENARPSYSPQTTSSGAEGTISLSQLLSMTAGSLPEPLPGAGELPDAGDLEPLPPAVELDGAAEIERAFTSQVSRSIARVLAIVDRLASATWR